MTAITGAKRTPGGISTLHLANGVIWGQPADTVQADGVLWAEWVMRRWVRPTSQPGVWAIGATNPDPDAAGVTLWRQVPLTSPWLRLLHRVAILHTIRLERLA